MSLLPSPIATIRELIAKDQIPAALEQLRALLDGSPALDEIIHQSGRFEHIRRQVRLGTASHDDATLTLNQIRAGLLDLIQEIEAQREKPELKEEMERAFGQSTIVQNAEKIYNINHIDKADFS